MYQVRYANFKFELNFQSLSFAQIFGRKSLWGLFWRDQSDFKHFSQFMEFPHIQNTKKYNVTEQKNTKQSPFQSTNTTNKTIYRYCREQEFTIFVMNPRHRFRSMRIKENSKRKNILKLLSAFSHLPLRPLSPLFW